jgi:hypothetical protein
MGVLIALTTLATGLEEVVAPGGHRALPGVGRLHLFPPRRVHAEVAPFWSQKETLAEYYRQRSSPDEKLLAYSMYWRGETFYSENEIYDDPAKEERTVFDQDGADEQMKDWIAEHRGRRVFIIYERGRQSHVQQLCPRKAVRPSRFCTRRTTSSLWLKCRSKPVGNPSWVQKICSASR